MITYHFYLLLVFNSIRTFPKIFLNRKLTDLAPTQILVRLNIQKIVKFTVKTTLNVKLAIPNSFLQKKTIRSNSLKATNCSGLLIIFNSKTFYCANLMKNINKAIKGKKNFIKLIKNNFSVLFSFFSYTSIKRWLSNTPNLFIPLLNIKHSNFVLVTRIPTRKQPRLYQPHLLLAGKPLANQKIFTYSTVFTNISYIRF